MRAALVPLLCRAAGGLHGGPELRRPSVPASAAVPWRGPGAADATSLADTKWFDLFHDDTLTQLVNTALAQNYDLRIAADRVLEARAQLASPSRASAGCQRVPPVSMSPRLPHRTEPLRSPRNQPRFQLHPGRLYAGLGAGCVRPAAAPERGRARAIPGNEEARRGVADRLIADVTTTYFQLRELDLELDIANQTRNVHEDCA